MGEGRKDFRRVGGGGGGGRGSCLRLRGERNKFTPQKRTIKDLITKSECFVFVLLI